MFNLRYNAIRLHFFLFIVSAYISFSSPLPHKPLASISFDFAATKTAPAELVVQLSHANPIVSMALSKSKNGWLLATAGDNEMVRLWEAESGNEIRHFKGQKGIMAVALSEDGRFLLTGSKDKTSWLWDTASGKKILPLEGHTEAVTTVAISPDASYLLTGSKDNTVRQWKTSDGSLIHKLEGFPGEISSIAISSDGRYALIGSNTIAQLRDLNQKGKLIKVFKGHRGGIYKVAISPNSRFVLTGSQDRTARLWDVKSSKEILRLKGHQKAVVAVTYSQKGEMIATGSKDGTIRIWDIVTKEEKHVLSVEQGKDGTMHIWDVKSEKKTTELFEAFVPEISDIAFSPDNKFIYFAAGKVAAAWSLEKHSLIRSFTGNSDLVSSVIFSPNDSLILIGSYHNRAYLWDIASGMPILQLHGHYDDVRAVAFSPDGNLVLTGGKDNARLWRVNDGTQVLRFKGPKCGVASVAFSPKDGRYILTGGDDGTARLWDREHDYKEVCNFDPYKEKWDKGKSNKNKVTSAVFSPDGSKVLTASKNTIRLWNRNGEEWDRKSEGSEKHKFEGHDQLIYSVAFSPTGDLAVSGSMDHTARVWNVESGTEVLKEPLYHPEGVTTAIFSQDGRYILSGCEDGIVRLWGTMSGTELSQFRGHTSGIRQVAFSHDQRYILSASRDQTVRLWEVTTGRELCGLINFRDGSWAVVDKEGRFDASNGGDVQGLHWVVGNETIELHQLKERYYEPHLLAKLLGFNQELLRNVKALSEVALYPAIDLSKPTVKDPKLRIHLTNRGGGIGKVIVSINGKEVEADARGPNPNPDAQTLELRVPFANHPYFIPCKENKIEVRALNADGYLSSRGVAVAYQPPGEAPVDSPTLWAIVAGVSEYEGEGIKLRYAAKDAEAMAIALTLGAKRLFGAKKIELSLLTSTNPEVAPTRANIEQAFEKVRSAKPWDILVVYLAGHGIALEDTYYFLTQEARSTNIIDPAIREQTSISSDDLVDWIKLSPALKQVMILDTCAAGSFAGKFVESRNISSDQIRAIERLKDRTGFHVLMGSAADAVSYEATQYEQGLLTYALLQGMRGAALRGGEFVDVSPLFQYAADEVPTLAAHIGGIQRPLIAAPKGTSFDIGQLTAEDWQQIPQAQAKPMLLPPVLLDSQEGFDNLELTVKLRRGLREKAYASLRGSPSRLPAVYIDAEQQTGAVRPSGTYCVVDGHLKADLVLVKEGRKITGFRVEGEVDDLDAFANKAVEEIIRTLQALK